MSFMTRFKKEPKFRLQMVALAALLFIMYNGQAESKKTFHTNEYCKDYGGITKQPSDCLVAGCVYREDLIPPFDDCFGCIWDGEKVVKSPYDSFPSKWDPSYICCSGKGLSIEDASDLPNKQEGIICKAADDPDVSNNCNKAEEKIAKIVQDMGLFKTECKMAYYTAVFGGGLLVLLIFAVAF